MALRLPTITRAPTTQGRQATPEDFGAQVAASSVQAAEPLRSLGEIATRISVARESARVSRLSAEYGLGAEDDVRQAIDSGSQPEELEGLVTESLRKRRTQAAEQLSGGWRQRFEANAAIEDQRTLVRVRDHVRDTQKKLAEQDGEISLQVHESNAGRADAGTDEANRIDLQAAQVIGNLQAAGILSPAQAMERTRKYESQVSAARRARSIRKDPQAAFLELQDHTSALAKGLTEVQRQQALDEALEATAAQFSQARSATNFAQAQQDRFEKEQAEEALRAGDELLAENDLAGLQSHLEKNRDILPPEKLRWYRERLAEGGGFGASVTNRLAYSDLLQRASKGDSIAEDADVLFRSGQMSRSDYERVLKVSEDQRFRDVEEFLEESFQQSLFRFDQTQQQRNAEALRAFSEFKLENPEATRAEATKFARELVKWTGVRALEELPPVPNLWDPAAAQAELLQRFDAGEISEEELGDGLAEIQAREQAIRQAETKP